MALLSLQEISVRYSGPWLLENATLNIERGERICLLGRNGEGKSTFLKVAAGELAPDEGEVVRSKNLVVAMMPQGMPTDLSGSVLETVRKGTHQIRMFCCWTNRPITSMWKPSNGWRPFCPAIPGPSCL